LRGDLDAFAAENARMEEQLARLGVAAPHAAAN